MCKFKIKCLTALWCFIRVYLSGIYPSSLDDYKVSVSPLSKVLHKFGVNLLSNLSFLIILLMFANAPV